MLKRHEVEILLKAGHAKTEVARLSGVSLRSVKRIAEERPVEHVEDARERAQRQIRRPSTIANFRKQVVEIVRETPDLASLEILRRVKESGYSGGKTALYALVASLRPKRVKPLVRFEGLPGEFSQHDFGEVEVEFLNGASQRIHFFASRLKYSRWVRVSLVVDEAVESLVRTLAEHLASWGGRPLLCVFDRPKTIALKWLKNGEVTEWNPIFAYATLEMGVGVELCWPYRAQQKGSVENLVGFVKSSFFKVRRFHDEEDLRQQLRDWHREVNQERPCRATGIIPAVRLAEEASGLNVNICHRSTNLRFALVRWPHPRGLSSASTALVGIGGTCWSLWVEELTDECARESLIDSIWVIHQRELVVSSAYFLHFDLVPTLNRVVVVPPDLATTECVVAPIDSRWVRRCGTEKEGIVLYVSRK